MKKSDEKDEKIEELENRLLILEQQINELKINRNENNLSHHLKKFWYQSQVEVNEKWRRTLPFADYVINRWEKAETLGFGKGTSIYDSALVLGEVKVGENTWIGPFTILDGSGGLEIGSFCSIASGVQIYTHDTVQWSVTGGKASPERAPTKVGDRCYIGSNTIIAKGVTVGDSCVIGANSLVIKDIPANSKAYGTPCRVISTIIVD